MLPRSRSRHHNQQQQEFKKPPWRMLLPDTAQVHDELGHAPETRVTAPRHHLATVGHHSLASVFSLTSRLSLL